MHKRIFFLFPPPFPTLPIGRVRLTNQTRENSGYFLPFILSPSLDQPLSLSLSVTLTHTARQSYQS